MKEETGLDVKIVRKIGEYHECGIHDGIENDYYPACYLVKSVGGSIKKQKTEVEEIRLFDLRDIPKTLVFVHSNMIKDYIRTKQNLTGS
mgnify:CR=1 FL=1